jgi:hypothetical protein|tara:strand:+ start:455 stop:667 length:213 start_codon:yes stop_codon:yes gene_type:complete
MGDSDIVKYLKDLENESKNMKLQIMKICWYMRGGVTWQEALNFSNDERDIAAQLIKDNLETTKKTGQPFF